MEKLGIGSICYPAFSIDENADEGHIEQFKVMIIAETSRSWVAVRSDGYELKIPKKNPKIRGWLTFNGIIHHIQVRKLRNQLVDLLSKENLLSEKHAEILANTIKLLKGAITYNEGKNEFCYENLVRKAKFRNAMRSVYESYQASDQWKNVVAKMKRNAGFICQNCNKSSVIGACHHKSYKNWGKGNYEEISDCIWLCHRCHAIRHARHSDEEPPFWAKRFYHDYVIDSEQIKEIYLNEI
jgi:hypothetical protein